MTDPVEHNFSIYIGQTLKYPFTVYNDEALTSEYDFTGCTVAAQARLNHNSKLAINLNPTIVGNTIYLNATPDQLTGFVIPGNNQSAKYKYDVEVTKPDLTKWTVVFGIIEAFPEETKI